MKSVCNQVSATQSQMIVLFGIIIILIFEGLTGLHNVNARHWWELMCTNGGKLQAAAELEVATALETVQKSYSAVS